MIVTICYEGKNAADLINHSATPKTYPAYNKHKLIGNNAGGIT